MSDARASSADVPRSPAGIDPDVFAELPPDIQQELLSAQSFAPPTPINVSDAASTWSCRVCTFLNHSDLIECEMCGTFCVDDTQTEADQQPLQVEGKMSPGSSLLRRLKLPVSPVAISFSQKRDPTAEDLLVAASSKFQQVKNSIQRRRSRSNSAAEDANAALPSLQAMTELTELQKDLNHKVLAGDEWFEASLERLWREVEEISEEEAYDRAKVDWVKLGFQNANPETDFRGGGMLALKCLLYAFEAHPTEMRAIHKQQNPDTKDAKHKKKWYPVCVAGINLTCLLAGLLRLGDGQFADKKRPFWKLFEEPAAFYELFFLAFMKMDAIWHRLNATYMEFGMVLKVTRKSVAFMLAQEPATLMDLREASDQTFLDRFVVSLSTRSLADWEDGECPDPNHSLEPGDHLTTAKSRTPSKPAAGARGDAVWPLR